MYEFLEGQVAGRGPARLVVDVQGVGYDVLVPVSARFPEQGRVRVWTHLVVREDAHTLYGFPERSTRDIFRILLLARGVGPVMALSILSGLSPVELVAAVQNEDVRALTRVKGVGTKTAQQILLDLRDKAARLAAELGGAEARAALPAQDALGAQAEDAIAALLSIGYSEKEARRAVEGALERGGPARDLETLVRAALST
ncbi:MAG: Holliday junction branch migration protein RuvA [Planctomycetes bacterium]|nr:Holliday junction branch migration protein RuvA [Planctomycetota bacterium]